MLKPRPQRVIEPHAAIAGSSMTAEPVTHYTTMISIYICRVDGWPTASPVNHVVSVSLFTNRIWYDMGAKVKRT